MRARRLGWVLTAAAARVASAFDLDTVSPCAAGKPCFDVDPSDLSWWLAVSVTGVLGLALVAGVLWLLLNEAARARRRAARVVPRPVRRANRVVAGPIAEGGTFVRLVQTPDGRLVVEVRGPRGWVSVDRDPGIVFGGLRGPRSRP